MAVVDELLAIGEEDRRKKQFLQDNPLFGMEPYHEVRPTYSNRYTEAVGSLLEPLMTKPDAGPLDINFWTGLLSTPTVKAIRPRESPSVLDYIGGGLALTPGVGVLPSIPGAVARRFIPQLSKQFDPSRRQFLKTSATVGALTGLGIPLAKKALTKSTGAIEGLAKTVSDEILKIADSSIYPKVYKIGDYLNETARTWLGSLDNIKARADEVQGDLVARSGDSLYNDLDSLKELDEHLGVDTFDPQYGESPTGQIIDQTLASRYGYGSATEGVLGDSYKATQKWADELHPDDIHDEYHRMYNTEDGSDASLELAMERMISDEYDTINFYAESIVDTSGNIKDTLNRLSYLEDTNPRLLIELIEEEIKKVSTQIKKIGDPLSETSTSTIYQRTVLHEEFNTTLVKLKELKDQIVDRLKPPKPKKKDDVSIVQRVLDPLGYTRMKAPYEK